MPPACRSTMAPALWRDPLERQRGRPVTAREDAAIIVDDRRIPRGGFPPMESLVHAMLSNALAATVLAVAVAGLARACRRPALIHGLWLVVMIKLVTPPLVLVQLPAVGWVKPLEPLAVRAQIDRSGESATNQSKLLAGATGQPLDDSVSSVVVPYQGNQEPLYAEMDPVALSPLEGSSQEKSVA